MKLSEEQIEIIDKLLVSETNRDDPCIGKKERKRIMQKIRETKEIPYDWWYEILETIGCNFQELTDSERQIIHPIYDGFLMQKISPPTMGDNDKS